MEFTNEIVVVDAIMGTGKTTWAKNYIKSHQNERFVFITPYLEEGDVLAKDTAPEREFVKPKRTSATDGKLTNFNHLIRCGKDIVSTHELFKRFTDDTKRELETRYKKYTLFIDETLDIVTPVKISPKDIELCIQRQLITIDKDGICKWIFDSEEYEGKFSDIKELALTGDLVCVNEKFFVRRLNPDIFTNRYFGKIFVLTYLFDGSIMKAYFDFYGIPYRKVSVKNGELVPYYEPDITEVAKLVTVYDGPLNESFPQKSSSLSSTWYKTKDNAKLVSQLKKNMDNYFKNITKAKTSEILWSTFLSDDSDSDRGNLVTMFGKTRYDKHFLSCNVRGTNKYKDRSTVAYMINTFLNPGIQHFFRRKEGVHVNENLHALQSMIQWIWRSRIRDGLPINVYVPSKRMRELLLKWLANEPIPDKA